MSGVDPVAAGMSVTRLGRLDRLLQRMVDEGQIAGTVTAVHRRGELAYLGAVGHQDLDTGRPMTADVIFNLASTTKAFTGVAAMILVEEGVLRLDDPVAGLVPELADPMVLVNLEGALSEVRPARRAITVRDLLTWRMGVGMPIIAGIALDAPISQAYDEVAAAPTQDEYLRRLGGLPLMDDPGGKLLYDAPSRVLGILVSRASGSELGQFLEDRVFGPLGMDDTGYFVPEDKRERFATLYMSGPDSLIAAGETPLFTPPTAAPAWTPGSHGLNSTASDLLTFSRMLLGKGEADGVRVLSRPTVELMARDHVFVGRSDRDFYYSPGFFDATGFGFCVQVQTERTEIGPSVGSFWWGGATGVWFLADPAEELAYAFMVHCLGGDLLGMRRGLNTAIYQAIAD
jgi:CubicO group peptidase (beta-lactamase class C family)